LIGIDWKEIKVLAIAKEKGYLEEKHIHEITRTIPVLRHIEKPPSRHILARIADSRMLYPVKRLLRPITDLPLAIRIAYGLHMVQDVYDLTDDKIINVVRKTEWCRNCGICAEYCPMGIEEEKIGNIPRPPACIQCLYCYFVCPERAIQLEGSLGFLSRIIDRYANDIRRAIPY
jgi:ferredoxin